MSDTIQVMREAISVLRDSSREIDRVAVARLREAITDEAIRRQAVEESLEAQKRRIADLVDQRDTLVSLRRPVIWTENEDGDWQCACGKRWEFPHGGPVENGLHYCPGCGHPVETRAYVEEVEDDDE